MSFVASNTTEILVHARKSNPWDTPAKNEKPILQQMIKV